MPVKAGYLFLAGAGGIVIWSGVRGKPVTSVFRSLIGGDNPAKIPSTYNIAGTTSGGTVTLTGAGPSAPVTVTAAQNSVNTAILMGLGAPPTPANLQSLARWQKKEFSSWPPLARYNPMASTQPEPGSTSFNSVGVQNYTSWTEGVQATIATINNGNYPAIVAAFRSGQGLIGQPGVSTELAIWSNGGYSSV